MPFATECECIIWLSQINAGKRKNYYQRFTVQNCSYDIKSLNLLCFDRASTSRNSTPPDLTKFFINGLEKKNQLKGVKYQNKTSATNITQFLTARRSLKSDHFDINALRISQTY